MLTLGAGDGLVKDTDISSFIVYCEYIISLLYMSYVYRDTRERVIHENIELSCLCKLSGFLCLDFVVFDVKLGG